MYPTFFPIPILAALLLITSLTSCGTTAGTARVDSTSPEFIQAKKALLDSLGDWTVKGSWVEATKTSSQSFLGLGPSSFIDSSIASDTYHYKGWQLTDDGILKARFDRRSSNSMMQDSSTSNAEISIPIVKVARVYVHDQQYSPESKAANWAESVKATGIDPGVKQSLNENVNHTAAAAIILNNGDPWEKYNDIHFPNRQRAQHFVDRLNHLLAVMRKR